MKRDRSDNSDSQNSRSGPGTQVGRGPARAPVVEGLNRGTPTARVARAGYVFGVLLLAQLAGGCALGLEGAGAPAAPTQPLVWPPPPAAPRIRFLQSVASPADLGIKPGPLKRLSQWVAGADEARFVRPLGLLSLDGVLYVTDPGAQSIWILDPRAGRSRHLERIGSATFSSPISVVVGPSGQIAVSDSAARRIYLVSPDGETLKGVLADPALVRPTGLAYDAARDRLYVADSMLHQIRVYSGQQIALNGSETNLAPERVLGQRGTGDGQFNFPTHLAVDGQGTLYVTDSMGFRIQSFDVQGKFRGSFGKHGDSGGDFASPKGVALDSDGHVYVVEALFDAVQIFDQSGQFLLTFGSRGLGPGQFWLPGGIFIDAQNRIFVADSYNQRVQVFEYLPGREP